MRYMSLLVGLLFLSACGLLGDKERPSDSRPSSDVSQHDRDLARCEMQAMEKLPSNADDDRVQRYTRLCMQSKGYAVDGNSNINVNVRDN